MNKKNNNQDNLIVSEFLVEAKELEIRYKSIKKNCQKFEEIYRSSNQRSGS